MQLDALRSLIILLLMTSQPVRACRSRHGLDGPGRLQPQGTVFCCDVTPELLVLAGTLARAIISHRSLAEERPHLARQWIHERNGSHTPSSVSAASGFTASWRCDRGCEHCAYPISG